MSGNINLTTIPSSFWGGQYAVDPATRLSIERYDVTVRVRVFANGDTTHAYAMGEDRRAFHLRHDDTELAGFPVNLGSSGEASPTLADIEGNGKLDTIVPTSDGQRSRHPPRRHRGARLPGAHRPAATGMDPAYAHNYLSDPTWAQNAVPRPGDEIASAVAVGDLNHTGALDIVASTLDGRTWAWDGLGRLAARLPQAQRRDGATTASRCRRRTRPTASSRRTCPSRRPCLPTSRATSTLDIIQAAGDNHVYA